MPSNPNHAPSSTTELSPEEQSVFSVAKINEWRAYEHAALAESYESSSATASFAYLDRNNVPEYVRQFNASVDGLLDAFLVESGIDASSPNYAEIRQLFYEARIGTGDGDGISGIEWDIAPANRGGDPGDTKSQSDIFRERIEQRVGVGVDDSSEPDPDTDPRGELTDAVLGEAYLENARFDVGKSRDAWATASAKRQGRVFDMKDKNREAIKDAYHENVQKLGIMELEDQISDSDSDTEKNAKVIAWLLDEQSKLRELTTEKLKSTKTSKFVEWMNTGGTMKRIGKSALIGVAASGAAAGISLVAGFGLVAGAAGGAAAGAVGFGRFVRGFAKGDRQRGMMTADEAFGTDGEPVDEDRVEGNTLTERFKDVANTYNVAFDQDTHGEQKKRRKAVVRGLTNVALGVGVGAAVHYVADFLDGDTETYANDVDHDGIPDDQDSFVDKDNNGLDDRTGKTIDGSDTSSDPDGSDKSTGEPGQLSRNEMFGGYHGTRALTPEAHELLGDFVEGYQVQSGDSVWSLSETFLHEQGIAHPTVYEIDATKDMLLEDLRAQGLVDSRGWLSTGDVLTAR